jgi:uncharacterized protein (TIGR03083 family)
MTDANHPLTLLRESHTRLASLIEPLGSEELTAMSYCAEWTIADVLSHLGSGAEISQLRLDAAIRGDEAPGRDSAQPVWDTWNAKSPESKAADGIAADGAFVDRLAGLDEATRSSIQLSMGPMQMDFAAFVTSRLSEHTLHSWDVAVVLDPAATLPDAAAALVLPNVSRIVRFTGKASEPYRSLHVHTTTPDTDLTLGITADGISLEPAQSGAHPDLTLPAEALIRLAYGRLDADHTPTSVVADGPDTLEQLRRAFPGV